LNNLLPGNCSATAKLLLLIFQARQKLVNRRQTTIISHLAHIPKAQGEYSTKLRNITAN
jgi:hypothetical protein